jgi:hypothetical protein
LAREHLAREVAMTPAPSWAVEEAPKIATTLMFAADRAERQAVITAALIAAYRRGLTRMRDWHEMAAATKGSPHRITRLHAHCAQVAQEMLEEESALLPEAKDTP